MTDYERGYAAGIEAAAKRIERYVGVHMFSRIDVTMTQRELTEFLAAEVRALARPAETAPGETVTLDNGRTLSADAVAVLRGTTRPAPTETATREVDTDALPDGAWLELLSREPSAPPSGVACATCGGIEVARVLVQDYIDGPQRTELHPCPDCCSGRRAT